MSPEDPLLFPTFPRTQRSIAGDQSRKETRRRDEKNEVSETHRVDFFYDIFFLTFFFSSLILVLTDKYFSRNVLGHLTSFVLSLTLELRRPKDRKRNGKRSRSFVRPYHFCAGFCYLIFFPSFQDFTHLHQTVGMFPLIIPFGSSK